MSDNTIHEQVLDQFSFYHAIKQERADDIDLGVRVLMLTSVGLSAVELGVLAFSKSRATKLLGAMAPLAVFGLAMETDQDFLKAQASTQKIAAAATEYATNNSLTVPGWALAANEDCAIATSLQ